MDEVMKKVSKLSNSTYHALSSNFCKTLADTNVIRIIMYYMILHNAGFFFISINVNGIYLFIFQHINGQLVGICHTQYQAFLTVFIMKNLHTILHPTHTELLTICKHHDSGLGYFLKSSLTCLLEYFPADFVRVP